MNNNKTDKQLDLLGQIQKVDAPPFLLTRIQQKISENYNIQFSQKFVWTIGISLSLILLMNVAVLVKQNKENNGVKRLAQSIQLMPNNSLYY